MANSDDDLAVSFWRQLFGTKERGAAWIFRILMMALTGCMAIIVWFAQDKLGSFNEKFDEINSQRLAIWKSIAEETSSQKAEGDTLIKLETTLTDHIDTENTILQGITAEEKDHEDRIRDLEGHPNR